MVYSLWKISIFLDFFETSLFWSKKHSSLSRIPKNDLFWLHLSKNYTCYWKVRFVDQNHGPLQNFDFSTFLKFYFSGLKSIRFYSEYQKTIFTGLICPKTKHGKKLDFNTKTIDKPLWKSSFFFSFLKRHFFRSKEHFFYPEYQKTIFSGLICPTNTRGNKLDFLTKTMDLPLWKLAIFWTFLKPHFFCLKGILFYPQY